MTTDSSHRYSIERLVHYSCRSCNRWWSIGDGPTAGDLKCPWCGDAAPVRTINDAEAAASPRKQHEV